MSTPPPTSLPALPRHTPPSQQQQQRNGRGGTFGDPSAAFDPALRYAGHAGGDGSEELESAALGILTSMGQSGGGMSNAAAKRSLGAMPGEESPTRRRQLSNGLPPLPVGISGPGPASTSYYAAPHSNGSNSPAIDPALRSSTAQGALDYKASPPSSSILLPPPNPAAGTALLKGKKRATSARAGSSGLDEPHTMPGPPPMDAEESERHRKNNHKEVERRRRETINDGINALRDLLPSTPGESSATAIKNKGSILQRAAEHITSLQEREAANLSKWTLEKVLLDQSVLELRGSADGWRAEAERLREENYQLRRELGESGGGSASGRSEQRHETERRWPGAEPVGGWAAAVASGQQQQQQQYQGEQNGKRLSGGSGGHDEDEEDGGGKRPRRE